MKRSELETAIQEILGEQIFSALIEHTNLPRTLKAAADKAFLDDMSSPQVDTVREAMRMLEKKPCHFIFEKEDENG